MERLKAGGDLVLEDHKRGEIDAHFATGARSFVRALSAFRIDTHQYHRGVRTARATGTLEDEGGVLVIRREFK